MSITLYKAHLKAARNSHVPLCNAQCASNPVYPSHTHPKPHLALTHTPPLVQSLHYPTNPISH